MENLPFIEDDQFLFQFEELNADNFKADQMLTLNQSQKLVRICDLYKIIKPILLVILSIPFVPRKIKEAIKIFIENLDLVCPIPTA